MNGTALTLIPEQPVAISSLPALVPAAGACTISPSTPSPVPFGGSSDPLNVPLTLGLTLGLGIPLLLLLPLALAAWLIRCGL
jgi:hypothetical protein